MHNWRYADPARPQLRVADLRLLVPTVDNAEERVFYLTQLEILARTGPVVGAVAEAHDAVLARDLDRLQAALQAVAAGLESVNRAALPLIDPRATSPTYVDPPVWAKTVAPLAVPIRPGLLGPSGTASPVINTLDAFLGRDRHDSLLGREILAHRRSYPPHWRRFVEAVAAVDLVPIIAEHGVPETRRSLEYLQQAYSGSNGFLERHRRKVFGYLAIAFKVGRGVTIGGFQGGPVSGEWERVDRELAAARAERPAHLAPAAPGPGRVRRPGTRRLGAVTAVELARHNEATTGWWVAVDGRVLDVTPFLTRHPGGQHILRAYAGLDATEAFRRAHRDVRSVRNLLEAHAIGELVRRRLPRAGQTGACAGRGGRGAEQPPAGRVDRGGHQPAEGRRRAADGLPDGPLRRHLPALRGPARPARSRWAGGERAGHRSGCGRSAAAGLAPPPVPTARGSPGRSQVQPHRALASLPLPRPRRRLTDLGVAHSST